MAERRIPRPDPDFSTYANHYAAAVHAFWAVHALDPAGLTALDSALGAWNSDFQAQVAARNAAEAATRRKDRSRRALEGALRPLSNFIQSYPATTDADRATIGITVRDTSSTPSPTPTSAPLVRVESGQRLTHRLRFIDSGDAGRGGGAARRGGKPPGKIGAEVWLALTAPHEPAPPPNPSGPGVSGAYSFLSVSSRGNLIAEFPSSEAGKTAYYVLRWVSTRGERGPWSEVASATVAA